MKRLFSLLMAATALACASARAEEDITAYPRVPLAEALVNKALVAAHLGHFNIRVVEGPISSCGEATRIGGQAFIVLNPRCYQADRRNMENYRASVLFHEIGHIVRGHVDKDMPTLVTQREADFFSGFIAALLGASEGQALTHASTTNIDNGIDPPRRVRVEAVRKGYRFGLAKLAQRELRDETYWNPEKEKVKAPPAADPPAEGDGPLGLHMNSFWIGVVTAFVFMMFINRR